MTVVDQRTVVTFYSFRSISPALDGALFWEQNLQHERLDIYGLLIYLTPCLKDFNLDGDHAKFTS